ncbi:COG2204: Response regulator containing CheY-like receiver, AAA-type ATPase, and DNA-binding domains [Pseudoalteromonas luteoviolacea B = ATCC 29581]|nr:COG2204: Response regulator containing CheY-like receiver, AAA-type ATPase, and DNA-binding domains [Pseudoalteromonas luteoviolacea B = ATCC 29581]
MPPKVLIVEDTESLAFLYDSYLIPTGIKTTIALNGHDAITAIEKDMPDVIILDVMLPDMNGLDLFAHLPPNGDTQVIVLTGHANKEMAIKAVKLGAADFIEKPIEAERFRITVNNALKIKTLSKEVATYKETYENGRFFDMIGSSKVMQSVYSIISSASQSKASVFITGESGTGKELCARALHQSSSRNKKPFVALNCAAIPKDLIESEIFGHVKGAFTGATSHREGAASRANGGTLFLDELCEMDINLQSKLLRFIQTGTITEVGGSTEKKVDVRFVCATNRDPLEEVRLGRFREDLYYRLHVIPVHLPPLRKRGGDVLEIAQTLFTKVAKEEGKLFTGLTDDAKQILLANKWPGNVRQLENVVRNTVVLNNDPWITADMLTSLIQKDQMVTSVEKDEFSQAINLSSYPQQENKETHDVSAFPQVIDNQIEPLWLIEKRYIERAIDICHNNIPKAAAMLDVSPSTIYRKIKSWEEMHLDA